MIRGSWGRTERRATRLARARRNLLLRQGAAHPVCTLVQTKSRVLGTDCQKVSGTHEGAPSSLPPPQAIFCSFGRACALLRFGGFQEPTRCLRSPDAPTQLGRNRTLCRDRSPAGLCRQLQVGSLGHQVYSSFSDRWTHGPRGASADCAARLIATGRDLTTKRRAGAAKIDSSSDRSGQLRS